MKTLKIPKLIHHKPAKRCSDFDEDCALVPCHFRCWQGVKNLNQADGYCPYVLQMMDKQE